MKGAALLLLLLGLASCGPLELAGDLAVGTAQAVVGVADAAL